MFQVVHSSCITLRRSVQKKNRNRVLDAASYKEWTNELNFDGIEFPVGIKQIEKFMRQNEKIAVNVYFYDFKEKRICPLFLALKSLEKERKYIHLLLLTEPSEEYSSLAGEVSDKKHYCWIKNLGGLVGSQLTSNRFKKIFCDRCLNYFSSVDQLKKTRTDVYQFE